MKKIPAIPTKYKGIQFRSRLEAKWAAFFDRLPGWRWEYEPIDLNGWIPDFYIYFGSNHRLLVEVRPESMREGLKKEIELADPPDPVLVVGSEFNCPALGESFWNGEWCSCGIVPADERLPPIFVPMPVGDATPEQLVSEARKVASEFALGIMGWLQRAWADACNEVQWKGGK